jgi:hypothetical protein
MQEKKSPEALMEKVSGPELRGGVYLTFRKTMAKV